MGADVREQRAAKNRPAFTRLVAPGSLFPFFLLGGVTVQAWLLLSRPVAPVTSPDKVVAVTAKQVVYLTVELQNSAWQSVRVVGAATGCGAAGCIDVSGVPVTIPPRGSASVRVRFTGMRPGTHTKELPIYLDWETQPVVVLLLHAQVHPASDPDTN